MARARASSLAAYGSAIAGSGCRICFTMPRSCRPANTRLFLERMCDDPAVRADVLAMLKEDEQGASMLDGDIAVVAGKLLQQPDDPPVRKFGAYRILRVLGEGGMGVVHLAQREDLGSLVAVKILRDAWMSPARRDRFTREQRTLARLTHPSIARLYDADTLPDGTPWFAMEYVEGVPLTEFCTRNTCSIERRLLLVRAVCEAVQSRILWP